MGKYNGIEDDVARDFFETINELNKTNPFRDIYCEGPYRPEMSNEYAMWLIAEIEKAGVFRKSLAIDRSNPPN